MILIDDNTRLSSHDFDYTVNIVAYEFRDRATLWKGYTVLRLKSNWYTRCTSNLPRGRCHTGVATDVFENYLDCLDVQSIVFFFSIRPLFEPDLYKFIYLNIYIHISLSFSLFLITWYVSLSIYFWKKKRGGYSDIRWKTFAKRKFIKILLNSIVNFWILANPAGDECLETISLSSNFSSLAPL